MLQAKTASKTDLQLQKRDISEEIARVEKSILDVHVDLGPVNTRVSLHAYIAFGEFFFC